jgi:dihydroneopterin aldolase
MRDRIELRGMRFEGRHGVSDEEQALPQLLEVDVELELDLGPAAASDQLADTVDYGPIVEACRAVVEDGRQRLLEAIAGAVADRALAASPVVEAVTVRVRKLAVPIDADLDFAEVDLRRERGAMPGPRASPG